MKQFYLLLFSSILLFHSNAQDFLGLQSSNYAGVNGVISNPANIADNRFKVDVNLIGFNIAAGNNYVGFKRSSLKYTGSVFNPSGIVFPNWDIKTQNNLVYNNGNFDKAAIFNMRLMGPSALITLNSRNAIALTTNFRSYLNVGGASQQLVDFVLAEFNDPKNFNKKLSNKNLSFQTMSWIDVGLTWGHVFKDQGKHFWKGGITPKLLLGVAAAYFQVSDLQYDFTNKDTVSFFKSNIHYAHSDNLDYQKGSFTNLKNTGYPGFGMDIGVVYEYRPHMEDYIFEMDGDKERVRRDKNKYLLRAGLSIVDIGGIGYKKGIYSNDFVADINLWDLTKVTKLTSITSIDSVLYKTFKKQQSSSTFFMLLPTAINANVDYHIWKPFYINLSGVVGDIFSQNYTKVYDYSSVTLAPRFDHKWFGLTVPFTTNAMIAQRGQFVAMGLMARIGPLIIGSNDFLSMFSGDVYASSFYMILKVPIPYNRIKDRDNDKISNRQDRCIDVPGTWEFRGCPDSDGDHVQDIEDKCPFVAGIPKLQGCPDRDNDGIMDSEDMCPDSAGTAEFKGCPDRDNDRIIDRLDACPDVAGLEEFKGCPDTDADGIPDKDDECPQVFGQKQFNGCADKDADGLADNHDDCPEISGPVENKGCPWPDRDKDGVLDKDDNCPDVPGIVELKGCPQPKPSDPVPQDVPMKAAEKKIIEKAFATLEFASGKDIIKPVSLPALNDLAKLLIAHQADWKLKLTGHTDNQGNADANMLLSEKRAKAVKAYLVKRGAKEEQVETEWHGQEQPIADNKTPKGRQKNRRVEMKIIATEIQQQ